MKRARACTHTHTRSHTHTKCTEITLNVSCMNFVQQDTYRISYRRWFPSLLRRQSWLQASNNAGILNTCTRLWQTDSEQATPVDLIKDEVRSSVKVPEFDKHLKKPGGLIGLNVVEITIKTKTIVRKPLMIIISLTDAEVFFSFEI